MSAPAAWQLSARITRWCVVVGTSFVALLAVIGVVLEHLETQQELDAIVAEELGEMVAAFAASRGAPADFAACATELQASHPDDGMAWRVWRDGDGSVWSSLGRAQLVTQLPETRALAPALDNNSRWRTTALTPEFTVGLLLEGGREVASERQFLSVALATVACAAGMSFLAGRILGRRIGGVLREIASETRAGHTTAVAALPTELGEVVLALNEGLARIRGESDQARLLASGLAHELRSPLQNLLLQAEVVLLRERDPAEYRGALARQIVELQELIRAVDNLVTLCAPPEARRARHGERFDLAAEIGLRLRGEEERARRANVALVRLLPASLSMRGDRESLMLALRNLVANALDWSPAGGRVEVRIGSDDNGVHLQVDDQGPGVPEAERARVFLPFERGQARPDGRVGYGLGLALVRTVVELHQGTVRVTSSPLGGASFRLEIPHPPGEALRE